METKSFLGIGVKDGQGKVWAYDYDSKDEYDSEHIEFRCRGCDERVVRKEDFDFGDTL